MRILKLILRRALIPVVLVKQKSWLRKFSQAKMIYPKYNENNKLTLGDLFRHRLSSVMHADKTIVLEKGESGIVEVAEEGKHNELVERDGRYARLWGKHIGAAEDKGHQRTSIEGLFDE